MDGRLAGTDIPGLQAHDFSGLRVVVAGAHAADSVPPGRPGARADPDTPGRRGPLPEGEKPVLGPPGAELGVAPDPGSSPTLPRHPGSPYPNAPVEVHVQRICRSIHPDHGQLSFRL